MLKLNKTYSYWSGYLPHSDTISLNFPDYPEKRKAHPKKMKF